jgi:hypothetical protein
LRDLILNMKQGVKEFRDLVNKMNLFLVENRDNIHTFTADGLPALTQFLKEGKQALSTITRVGEALERSPSRFISNDPRQGVRVP